MNPRKIFEKSLPDGFSGRLGRFDVPSQNPDYHKYVDGKVQALWGHRLLMDTPFENIWDIALHLMAEKAETELYGTGYKEYTVALPGVIPATGISHTFLFCNTWRLHRSSKCWDLSGNVPEDVARYIHHQYGMWVRVNGHGDGIVKFGMDCMEFTAHTHWGLQFLLQELHELHLRRTGQAVYTRGQVLQAFDELGGEHKAATALVINRETNTHRAMCIREYYLGNI